MVVTVKSHLIVNHHFYLTHTVHIIFNTVEKTNMAGGRGGGGGGRGTGGWEYKRNKKKGTGREKVVGIFHMAEMGKVHVAIKKITVVNIV